MSTLDSTENLKINRLHQHTCAFVLAVTGGGSRAISDLLGVPGASNTLLECLVPYSNSSLANFIGTNPKQACSATTARNMAMKAYERALLLSDDTQQKSEIYGLGCSAAIGTLRERKGSDRCFVAIQSTRSTMLFSLALDKTLSRTDQETLCNKVIIGGMCLATGLEKQISINELKIEMFTAPLDWQKLMSGEAHKTEVALGGSSLIFPGAFNPPHEGHRKIAKIAEQMTGMALTYEISISNVDKINIDFLDMAARQKYFSGSKLIFTRAATFAEKSDYFPGATFIVGVDTICRIAETRYYKNDVALRDIAINKLADNGHRFLVFGRLDKTKFLTLSDIELPSVLRELCEEITEDEFREDSSSSEFRSNQNH
ncbi:MAG: hypothetical protein JKY88_14590 [Pseudomonadales bacterium]|nr:hypothetical protein [Pseudomonadales bacterium]